MGRLIQTGVSVEGHQVRAVESGQPVDSASIECSCGWSRTLEAYGKPWVVVEVQRTYERHLAEWGIKLPASNSSRVDQSDA